MNHARSLQQGKSVREHHSWRETIDNNLFVLMYIYTLIVNEYTESGYLDKHVHVCKSRKNDCNGKRNKVT